MRKFLTLLLFWCSLVTSAKGADVTIGTPSVEVASSAWINLPKYIVPTGSWDSSISTGRAMYWDGSNWWVKIATDDPAAPIEGNDYSYRYVVQEESNYILEQTTVDHKVSLPLYADSDTVRIIRVNDNFGRPTTPSYPTNVAGSIFDVPGGGKAVSLTWTEPKFATRVGNSPANALTSSIVQNLSIRDLMLYQIWRSSVNIDANSSTATYTLIGNALSTENQFLDSNVTAGVTYYYAIRSRDAYDPPDFSQFSQPASPLPVVMVSITLTVNVSKISGNSNQVFVTVGLPTQAKKILTKAPLISNGDGTWSIAFLDAAISAGKKIQYRYARATNNGEEIEPDQMNTASREHEFMLDPSKPQMDTSTVPYTVKIKDRWGVPTYDETPGGMPRLFSSISISSGVTEPGIGKGDAIGVSMDSKEQMSMFNEDESTPSAPGAVVWYAVNSTSAFNPIPSSLVPGVEVWFGTSSALGSPMYNVAVATEPGYHVVLSSVGGVMVPAAPSKAFGEPIARLFVKSGSSAFKFQPVNVNGVIAGNASQPMASGTEMPKWVDVSTMVAFDNTLQLRSGQRTGEIQLSWTAPTALNTYGMAHHYDVRYATFPIKDLSSFKAAKFIGRLEASMSGSKEGFATISMGDSAPGYYFAVVPIYDDWSAAAGAKVVIQFGRLGVAPKLLNVNAKLKDRVERTIVKGAAGPTGLGRVNIKADDPDANLRATLEIPRSGLDLTLAMATVRNALETSDDAATRSKIDAANLEAKTSTRKIIGALSAMNVVGDRAQDSSVVSYEVSDLSGNSYFNSDKKLAKLPLKITVPIPKTWDMNNNGIVDATEGTAHPVRLSDLRIYRLNTKGNFWELVNEGEHTVDLANGVVRAEVKHLSTFALFSAGSAKDLSQFVVYPNPFVPNDSIDENGKSWSSTDLKSGIIFDNLTPNSEIFIYTLNMDLVKRYKLVGANAEEQNGRWRWDARNDNGEFVASGLYIYMVKDDGAAGVTKKTGKLVIVR